MGILSKENKTNKQITPIVITSWLNWSKLTIKYLKTMPSLTRRENLEKNRAKKEKVPTAQLLLHSYNKLKYVVHHVLEQFISSCS